jgi:hypothetical protein
MAHIAAESNGESCGSLVEWKLAEAVQGLDVSLDRRL